MNTFSIFNDMNIYQVHISNSLKHFSRIKNLYGLSDYLSNDEPLLVFGMYDSKDYRIIKHHKSHVYILWGGSDFDPRIKKSVSYIDKITKLCSKNIYHIALSKNMAERMDKLCIPYTLIDFTLVDPGIFKPVENNDRYDIYIYNGFTEGKEWIYGEKYYKKVIKKLPEFNFVLSSDINVPYQDMPSIYSKCIVGIRLTKYDGNANTVQELGLMNIPVIYNDPDNEKCIKWGKPADIIHNILCLNIKQFIGKLEKYSNILLICQSGNPYDMYRMQILYDWMGNNEYSAKYYTNYSEGAESSISYDEYNMIVNNGSNILTIYFGIPQQVPIHNHAKILIDDDNNISSDVYNIFDSIYSSNPNNIKKSGYKVCPLHCAHFMTYGTLPQICDHKKIKYIILCFDFSPVSGHLKHHIINNSSNNLLLFGNSVDKYKNYGNKIVNSMDYNKLVQYISVSKYFLSDNINIINMFRTICVVYGCKIKYFKR